MGNLRSSNRSNENPLSGFETFVTNGMDIELHTQTKMENMNYMFLMVL